MTILVLNCGSSSIKYQVIKMQNADNHNLLASGLVERIGLTEGVLKHKPVGKRKVEIKQDLPGHTEGIELILKALVDQQHGVLQDINEVSAVGHRVVHGGEHFTGSVLITDKVKQTIEKCFDLAPLHNPANLKGIMAMERILPNVPQVGVFDTSFHQTMPAKAFMYGIPYKYYEQYRVRRYGFHGTSHRYVAQKACKILGLDFNAINIVTCHLGGGASIASICKGKSVDTSMGFTPVDGLMMGTRSGAVDPGVLFFLGEKENMNLKGLSDMVNKRGGMIGISGLSSDMRDLEEAAAEGNERAQLALDMFYYRVKKFVGAHAAAMDGMDLLIFTGGIGENDGHTRELVSTGLSFMGVDFNSEINRGARGKDLLLTKPSSKVKVMCITTNEELVIALDTMAIVEKIGKE
ncbi:MAG: acetate kinase [Prevotellaceae bacterium]|jgi:acetate kinase|nr:acetate kinase [Prevotellaceae bacterium]